MLVTTNIINRHDIYITKRSRKKEKPTKKSLKFLVHIKISNQLWDNHVKNRSKSEEKTGTSGNKYLENYSISKINKKVVGSSAQKEQIDHREFLKRHDPKEHFLLPAKHMEMEGNAQIDHLYTKNNAQSSEHKEIFDHNPISPMGIH